MHSPRSTRSTRKKLHPNQTPKSNMIPSGTQMKPETPEKSSQQQSPKKLSLAQKMSINTENFVLRKVGSFDDDYIVVGKIGQGSFGSVYKVQHKALKVTRALKTIKKNPESKFSAFQEIEILKKLDHSNILKIYQFYEAKDHYYIVTDFFDGRELFDEILDNDKLSEEIAAQIVIQILRALNYIHLQGIAHRDIKAQNILLKKTQEGNYKVKIIDWGLGTLLDESEQRNRICGTPEYCAPEVLVGKYSISCDMWSLGVLVYIMLTGDMPFSGNSTQETIEQVKKGSFDAKDRKFRKLSSQAQNFIASLIVRDPKKRLSAWQCLQHPWIKKATQKNQEKPPQHLKETLQRLRNFKITNCFGMAVVSYVTNYLSSEEEKQNLTEIFRFLDKNGDGVLSAQQLIAGYSQIYGKAMATKIAEETFEKLDINQNGSLQYSQFVAFGMARHKAEERQKMKEAFNLFDKNKDGHISMEEIKEILIGKFGGTQVDEDEIKEVISQIDKNGDQEIDFQQFIMCVESIYEKVNKKVKNKKASNKATSSSKLSSKTTNTN